MCARLQSQTLKYKSEVEMSKYSSFIGIDIGKSEVVVGQYGMKSTASFPNSKTGIKKFFKTYKADLPKALVILETTGGYETLFLHALLDKDIAVHRANTRQVKSFIRSWGTLGKSDALDAQALALYGFERHQRLPLFKKPSPEHIKLTALTQRRQDLTQMLVQEKNRLQSPQNNSFIIQCCKQMIRALEEQISLVTKEIETLINNDPLERQKKEILESIPGIGPIVSIFLLAFMPELGQINRRQAASLAGLAPHPYESGQKIGYRRTKGGREQVRSALFIAAMAARNSNSPLKAFYEKLIGKGKKKMVALTALMRKILVIANAKLKELNLDNIATISV
jgi:transposase